MTRVFATSAAATLARYVVRLADGSYLRDKAGRIRTFGTLVQAEAAVLRHAPEGRALLRATAGV